MFTIGYSYYLTSIRVKLFVSPELEGVDIFDSCKVKQSSLVQILLCNNSYMSSAYNLTLEETF